MPETTNTAADPLSTPDVMAFPHSSNIAAGEWDAERKLIIITFKGGQRYAYADCSHAEWLAICRADSVGRAVNRVLKDGRPYVRIK